MCIYNRIYVYILYKMKCLNSRTTYLKPKLIAVQKKGSRSYIATFKSNIHSAKFFNSSVQLIPLTTHCEGGVYFFFRVVNHANVQEHLFLDGQKPVGYMISFAQSMGFKAWLWWAMYFSEKKNKNLKGFPITWPNSKTPRLLTPRLKIVFRLKMLLFYVNNCFRTTMMDVSQNTKKAAGCCNVQLGTPYWRMFDARLNIWKSQFFKKCFYLS